MTRRRFNLDFAICVFVTSCMLMPSSASAVTLGMTDTFTPMNTSGWSSGNPTFSPNRIAVGGPGGAADPYLQVLTNSTGTGQSRRLVAFNNFQWTGDYVGQSITRINMDVNNFGNSALSLRLAFGDGGAPRSPASSTWYVSTTPVTVGAGSGWTNVDFLIDAASLTQTSQAGGNASYNSVMSNVVSMRIVHATGVSPIGNTIVSANLGVDNINAIPEPSAAAFLALAGVAIYCGRAWNRKKKRDA